MKTLKTVHIKKSLLKKGERNRGTKAGAVRRVDYILFKNFVGEWRLALVCHLGKQSVSRQVGRCPQREK